MYSLKKKRFNVLLHAITKKCKDFRKNILLFRKILQIVIKTIIYFVFKLENDLISIFNNDITKVHNKHNTVFRQAFLLIQYSFICKQYFFCSDREYQYFFLTDGKQNS